MSRQCEVCRNHLWESFDMCSVCVCFSVTTESDLWGHLEATCFTSHYTGLLILLVPPIQSQIASGFREFAGLSVPQGVSLRVFAPTDFFYSGTVLFYLKVLFNVACEAHNINAPSRNELCDPTKDTTALGPARQLFFLRLELV